MRKYIILAVFAGNFCAVFACCGKDSIETKYYKGEFITVAHTNAKALFDNAQIVENKFVSQFNTDFAKLFDWAFKDMGEQQDASKNAFLLEIKSCEFDKMSGISTITTDITVSSIKRFKDVIIKAKITQTGDKQTYSHIVVDIYYSNLLLRKAYGTIFVETCNDKEIKLTTTVSVRFSWFFNIFVTKKVYKDVIEWRLQKFLNNIKKEVLKQAATGD
ncbi:MAG: hypothetical protein LBB53_02460 [Prevotellaceae bacterium]|jgi:hypothetical protein|nr:hypothetical protein [Prevotellaceae bacterium]